MWLRFRPRLQNSIWFPHWEGNQETCLGESEIINKIRDWYERRELGARLARAWISSNRFGNVQLNAKHNCNILASVLCCSPGSITQWYWQIAGSGNWQNYPFLFFQCCFSPSGEWKDIEWEWKLCPVPTRLLPSFILKSLPSLPSLAQTFNFIPLFPHSDKKLINLKIFRMLKSEARKKSKMKSILGIAVCLHTWSLLKFSHSNYNSLLLHHSNKLNNFLTKLLLRRWK